MLSLKKKTHSIYLAFWLPRDLKKFFIIKAHYWVKLKSMVLFYLYFRTCYNQYDYVEYFFRIHYSKFIEHLTLPLMYLRTTSWYTLWLKMYVWAFQSNCTLPNRKPEQNLRVVVTIHERLIFRDAIVCTAPVKLACSCWNRCSSTTFRPLILNHCSLPSFYYKHSITKKLAV